MIRKDSPGGRTDGGRIPLGRAVAGDVDIVFLMIAPALVAALLASAANPDPGQPVKDCAHFVAHYRALLQDQAEVDVSAARKPEDRVPPKTEDMQARAEAGQVAGEVEDAVAHACRRANGSQYECVVMADGYKQLAACVLPGIPMLPGAERRELPSPEPPPPTAEQRADADRTVEREYVRTGDIDLEALGTGSAREAEAEQSPAASEGR